MDGNSSEYNYCNFITRVSHTPVAIHHMTRLADFNAKSRLRSARTVTHHLILSIANSVTFALFSLAGARFPITYIYRQQIPHIGRLSISKSSIRIARKIMIIRAAPPHTNKALKSADLAWLIGARTPAARKVTCGSPVCLRCLHTHTVKHSSCYY
jgi:hypothetical protein